MPGEPTETNIIPLKTRALRPQVNPDWCLPTSPSREFTPEQLLTFKPPFDPNLWERSTKTLAQLLISPKNPHRASFLGSIGDNEVVTLYCLLDEASDETPQNSVAKTISADFNKKYSVTPITEPKLDLESRYKLCVLLQLLVASPIKFVDNLNIDQMYKDLLPYLNASNIDQFVHWAAFDNTGPIPPSLNKQYMNNHLPKPPAQESQIPKTEQLAPPHKEHAARQTIYLYTEDNTIPKPELTPEELETMVNEGKLLLIPTDDKDYQVFLRYPGRKRLHKYLLRRPLLTPDLARTEQIPHPHPNSPIAHLFKTTAAYRRSAIYEDMIIDGNKISRIIVIREKNQDRR